VTDGTGDFAALSARPSPTSSNSELAAAPLPTAIVRPSGWVARHPTRSSCGAVPCVVRVGDGSAREPSAAHLGGSAVALIRSTDAAAVGKAVVATCRQREFTEPGVFTVTSGPAARRHTPRSDG
jgi:hypothetical protein